MTAVSWRPLRDIFDGQFVSLAADGVSWNDALQGGLGNCWLIAALSSAAEKGPEFMNSTLLTPSYSPDGQLSVKLYDRMGKQWYQYNLKDAFPVDAQGKAAFSKPAGHEAWVMVLEVAFASLFKGWQQLVGGNPCAAWECITGKGSDFYKNARDGSGGWKAGDTTSNGLSSTGQTSVFYDPGTITTDQVFEIMKEADHNRDLIAACSPGTSDSESSPMGIVQRHAFSVLAVRDLEGHKLILVRNPWGKGEWNGPWSDGAPEWAAYPNVAKATSYHAAVDGCFWIDAANFFKEFECVQICRVSGSQRPKGMGSGMGADGLGADGGGPVIEPDLHAGEEFMAMAADVDVGFGDYMVEPTPLGDTGAAGAAAGDLDDANNMGDIVGPAGPSAARAGAAAAAGAGAAAGGYAAATAAAAPAATPAWMMVASALEESDTVAAALPLNTRTAALDDEGMGNWRETRAEAGRADGLGAADDDEGLGNWRETRAEAGRADGLGADDQGLGNWRETRAEAGRADGLGGEEEAGDEDDAEAKAAKLRQQVAGEGDAQALGDAFWGGCSVGGDQARPNSNKQQQGAFGMGTWGM